MWITCFDAFGNLETNPSEALAKGLVESGAGEGYTVLPTSFERGQEELEYLLTEKQPTKLLMLGYAEGADLRLENFAHNASNPRGVDNDGFKGETPLYNHSPERYQTTWNLYNIKNNVERFELPFELSQDAGGFVCNAMFYFALDVLPVYRDSAQIALVHVSQKTRLEDLVNLVKEN